MAHPELRFRGDASGTVKARVKGGGARATAHASVTFDTLTGSVTAAVKAHVVVGAATLDVVVSGGFGEGCDAVEVGSTG